MREPTAGSLFSGCGALDLALEAAGWDVRWQCESDPWCRAVLAEHWPGLLIHPDIRTLADAEPVDLIAAGPPCQPISQAGRRQGEDDERWLWPELFRVVRLVKPRFLLLENPDALLTLGFGYVLGELAACGYDADWEVLSAADVGAPHLRKRLWITAESADAMRIERWPHAEGRDDERHGCDRAVAHTDSLRRKGCESAQGRESLAVANTLGDGLEGPEAPSVGADGVRTRAVESSVGLLPHGVARRLDEHRWPAGRFASPHAWEPPRTVAHYRGRNEELRMLGNAVVPACAVVFARRLMSRWKELG